MDILCTAVITWLSCRHSVIFENSRWLYFLVLQIWCTPWKKNEVICLKNPFCWFFRYKVLHYTSSCICSIRKIDFELYCTGSTVQTICTPSILPLRFFSCSTLKNRYVICTLGEWSLLQFFCNFIRSCKSIVTTFLAHNQWCSYTFKFWEIIII